MVLTSAIAPEAAEDVMVWQEALASIRMLTDRAIAHGSKILQIMVDPADTVRCRLGLDSGFKDLTELIYLARLTAAPMAENNLSEGL